ncbi:MAG: UDP-N-acetylmuramoyl-tripeptide--D-alanyl-D-alanine ligase [Firmicutes bacterium]|nr:UDP-N-acetylmuramoyl-tripeptide--D-alanyl-D-alanine ligase [candidate division NPL-UPA2 bacterium]MBT9154082.1 UDP-N-acetylmuramoyl-tripeptide--D-alanyl-D-alanine ligase [candidate division NPL-UPA2 bacterium]
MTRLNLDWVAAVTGGRLEGQSLTAEGVASDSRKVSAGQLFFALIGAREDGHAHVRAAVQAGAVAAVVSRSGEYGCPAVVVEDTRRAIPLLARAYMLSTKTRVVAITGSVGKTSCKELTAAALSSQYSVLKSTGNQNTEIGLPISVLSHQDEEVMVLEMAMRGLGQIAFLTSIAPPDVAVVTNIGEAHIELLGSRDNIARAKAEILQGSKPNAIAILNRDDDYFAHLSRLALGSVVSFGVHAEADWVIGRGEANELGHYSFLLSRGTKEYAVRCPWPGRHHIHNAAAAVAVACVMGAEPTKAIDAIAACAPSEQRLNVLLSREGVTIIDDTYNASPISMLAALATLSETKTAGRRIAVLGSMYELGSRSQAAHREVGGAAAAICDIVITVGTEALDIAVEVSSRVTKPVYKCHTPSEALLLLKRELRPLDVVLIKGSRGLRLEQIVVALLKEVE